MQRATDTSDKNVIFTFLARKIGKEIPLFQGRGSRYTRSSLCVIRQSQINPHTHMHTYTPFDPSLVPSAARREINPRLPQTMAKRK